MPVFFGFLSIAFGLAAYVPYFVEIWRGKVRPHIFSWITWVLLMGLGYVLSRAGGGGEGAWVFGFMAAGCLAVVILALFRGERQITRLDAVSFAAALCTLLLYAFTRDAVASVILAATIDSLGFVPTFRKSYAKPTEETASTYFIAMFSYVCSILALHDRTFVTLFYPSVLVLSNGAFVAFVLWRRRAMKISTTRR